MESKPDGASLIRLSEVLLDGADLIYAYVPDLQIDIIEPLRNAGFSDEEIGTLGQVFV